MWRRGKGSATPFPHTGVCVVCERMAATTQDPEGKQWPQKQSGVRGTLCLLTPEQSFQKAKISERKETSLSKWKDFFSFLGTKVGVYFKIEKEITTYYKNFKGIPY